jgi:DNA-binding NtrC family response regulator
MKACVLVAAPADRLSAVADAVGAFATRRVSDDARAELLATLGHFQAIVVADGFLVETTQEQLGTCPLIRLGPTPDLPGLAATVEAAVRNAHEADLGHAEELERLSRLPYEDYIDLVRFSATRRYLLGLMRRHRGSVTEASLAAGIARESLHRQLRRHDVDAHLFREPDAR